MRTKQKNFGKCKCGRPILIGHLKKYNGGHGVCGACNAERMIEEIENRVRPQGLDSTDSDGYDS